VSSYLERNQIYCSVNGVSYFVFSLPVSNAGACHAASEQRIDKTTAGQKPSRIQTEQSNEAVPTSQQMRVAILT
jgi:hypothetical protein